jgi:hypothetical protein
MKIFHEKGRFFDHITASSVDRVRVVASLIEQTQNDRESNSHKRRAGSHCGTSVEDRHRGGHGRRSGVLDERG